jgi:enoyl-CoA hydratase/carnithine racemase
VEDQIATLTFNRPEHRHPISVDMLGEVADAVRAAQQDDGVRVLVLTGAGRAFCSGGDVKSMAKVASAGGGAVSARQEQVGLIQETQLLLRRFPKVLIAAVNGAAYGAGLDLACAADFRLAARNSTRRD